MEINTRKKPPTGNFTNYISGNQFPPQAQGSFARRAEMIIQASQFMASTCLGKLCLLNICLLYTFVTGTKPRIANSR